MGTLINVAAIIAGGIAGLLFGNFLKENYRESLIKAIGLCVIFAGIAGAMEGMLKVNGGTVTSGGTLLLTGSLAAGSVIGEWLDIDGRFTRFGEYLKEKTGNAKDKDFVSAFVTASFTVCIGAMAIVGAIQDGITGDYSTLLLKAILDFLIIMIMSASLGKGCVFSAIPVGILQGSVYLLAGALSGLMTDAMIANLSFTGSVLIFCVGVNLIREKTFRVANMLPGIVIAMIAAML